MAKFFIDHPVFACVISIIIALVGGISAMSLPVAQYPQISYPRISVSTNYVGANAEVIEETVAQAIEKQVNGVDDMIDMRSTSDNSGNYSLDVKFNLSSDADMDMVKVQNRVAQANASLPSEVTQYGVTTRKRADETIMYFSLMSPNGTYDELFMKNYGATQFVDALKRVKGVSEVNEYGPELSLRIWLDPMKMAQNGLTAADISTAVKQQNIQAPVGTIGGRPSLDEQEFQYSARLQGRLKTEEEFGNIVLKNNNGQLLHLRDIARIEYGKRDDAVVGRLDGVPAMQYAITLNSDANSLESVSAIRKVLADAEKNFPPDLKLVIVQDNTDYVRESLKEVGVTFVETLILVVLITWIFLQSWRATLIPVLAIPVSLLGTFTSFYIFGFTINTLTLFALVLAIGIVVDDAIVVVEAVEYNVDELGMSAKEATFAAMRSVSGAIVATAFVLLAVFLPVSFMGGATGVLYKQFALTIVVALSLSAVVAMSLSPAVSSLVILPKTKVKTGKVLTKVFGVFNKWLEWATRHYVALCKKLLQHYKVGVCMIGMVFVLIGFFFKMIPSGYVPDEDQSFMLVTASMPAASSTNRSAAFSKSFGEKLKNIPGVKYVMEIIGVDVLSNTRQPDGVLFPVKLDDIDTREAKSGQKVQEIINKVAAIGADTPEATVRAFNVAVLPGMSSTGSLSLYIMDTVGKDTATMNQDVGKLLGMINQRPEVAMAYTTFSNNTPSVEFELDREKTESLNIPVSNVTTALQANLGGTEINDFNLLGRTWKVIMQADPKFRADTKELSNIFVKNTSGDLIPISAVVKAKEIQAPPVITRFHRRSAERQSAKRLYL